MRCNEEDLKSRRKDCICLATCDNYRNSSRCQKVDKTHTFLFASVTTANSVVDAKLTYFPSFSNVLRQHDTSHISDSRQMTPVPKGKSNLLTAQFSLPLKATRHQIQNKCLASTYKISNIPYVLGITSYLCLIHSQRRTSHHD